MAAERLQKLLSRAGVASRRHAEELIVAGRVAVNGEVRSALGSRADPEVDTVTVDGVPIMRERYRYLALNKPAGVLSAASDDRGRRTVLDVAGPAAEGLHPAGRLDQDSEGLIFLTNDGALTNLLTHPRHAIEKEYLVEIDRPLAERDLKRLVRGIDDEGERLRARSVVQVTPDGGSGHWLSIVLTEGRKREIRRMLARLERQVGTLRRVRIGPVGLGGLPVGATRELSAEEVTALYAAAAQRP